MPNKVLLINPSYSASYGGSKTSIVNPVAPVSAADMYRRPQYITKSLFSEYFK